MRAGTRVVGFLVIALIAALGACGKDSSNTRDEFADDATRLVDDLASGKFAAVVADFDPTVKAQLPESALANAWQTYQEVVGNYKNHVSVETVKKGALSVERVTIITVRGSGEVRVTYHADGTIGGLYFLRYGAPPP
jgi:hypothetical protein